MGGYWEAWPIKLEPYMRQRAFSGTRIQGVLRCKEQGRTWVHNLSGGTSDQAGYGYNFLYLGLPYRGYAADASPIGPRSYSLTHNPYNALGGFARGSAKQSIIKNPAQTICLVDAQFIWAMPPFAAGGSPPGTANWGGYNMNTLIRPRHNNQSNIAWADGHVSSMNTDQLVKNGWPYGNVSNVSPPHTGKAMSNELWDTE